MLTTVLKTPPSVPAASSTSASVILIRGKNPPATARPAPPNPLSRCDPRRIRPLRPQRTRHPNPGSHTPIGGADHCDYPLRRYLLSESHAQTSIMKFNR